VPGAHQAPRHIPAHPADADHSKLHGLSLRPGGRQRTGRLEGIDELLVAARDLGHGFLPRRLPGSPRHERIPEHGPAHREADESRDSRGRRQPVAHLPGILAAAQDDAAHVVATAAARSGDDRLAILVLVESLVLPDVVLDLLVFKLIVGLDYQLWPLLSERHAVA